MWSRLSDGSSSSQRLSYSSNSSNAIYCDGNIRFFSSGFIMAFVEVKGQGRGWLAKPIQAASCN